MSATERRPQRKEFRNPSRNWKLALAGYILSSFNSQNYARIPTNICSFPPPPPLCVAIFHCLPLTGVSHAPHSQLAVPPGRIDWKSPVIVSICPMRVQRGNKAGSFFSFPFLCFNENLFDTSSMHFIWHTGKSLFWPPEGWESYNSRETFQVTRVFSESRAELMYTHRVGVKTPALISAAVPLSRNVTAKRQNLDLISDQATSPHRTSGDHPWPGDKKKPPCLELQASLTL